MQVEMLCREVLVIIVLGMVFFWLFSGIVDVVGLFFGFFVFKICDDICEKEFDSVS